MLRKRELTAERVEEFEKIFDQLLKLSQQTEFPEAEFLFCISAMATGFIYASYEANAREEVFESYITLTRDLWSKRVILEDIERKIQ